MAQCRAGGSGGFPPGKRIAASRRERRARLSSTWRSTRATRACCLCSRSAITRSSLAENALHCCSTTVATAATSSALQALELGEQLLTIGVRHESGSRRTLRSTRWRSRRNQRLHSTQCWPGHIVEPDNCFHGIDHFFQKGSFRLEAAMRSGGTGIDDSSERFPLAGRKMPPFNHFVELLLKATNISDDIDHHVIECSSYPGRQ